MEGQSKAATIVNPLSENQTQVTSEIYVHNSYSDNLICFIEKMFIKDAQNQNIANLKAILKK